MSLLIRTDSPSPLLLTERLISYLHQSAPSVWHQSIRMRNCSSSLKSKSVHPLDPIGHARQHHLVWTEEIKKKGLPSEVGPSAAASASQNECKVHFLWVSTYCFSSWSFHAVNLVCLVLVVPPNLLYQYHCKGMVDKIDLLKTWEHGTKSSWEVLDIYRLCKPIPVHSHLARIFIILTAVTCVFSFLRHFSSNVIKF